ncbi:MAG: SusC/RagA family TonB-linked outer membrane protein [Draconibacterium sp.]|nr:SusC/RagA family TonB-linked outer membrane protein [Draconibacterium sp.]
MVCSLPQMLYAQNTSEDTGLKSDTTSFSSSHEKEVDLIFNTMSLKRMNGSVSVIDVQKELERDQSSTFYQKVPGMFGNRNTWGTGNAILVVDGIQREGSYTDYVYNMEIESIVVLKDALSKAVYGAIGDQGVILIKTKRGKVGQHELRVFGSVETLAPRALPNYLNAADYMGKYNEAQLNDGVDPASLAYKQGVIDRTRSGQSSALYPDNDFYSQDYIKEFSNQQLVFADVAGGNDKARYYMNTSWNRTNGFLNAPQNNINNVLRVRGNLDFTINKYMKMGVDAFASIDQNKQPNAGDYFDRFATIKPNDYPVLWDPTEYNDLEARNALIREGKLIDGQFLGGSSSFLNNILGDLTQNGNTKEMKRNVQFSSILDLDLSFITPGLAAKAYGGMNFYNTLYSRQEQSYAVYEPFDSDNTRFESGEGVVTDVTVHGKDELGGKYHVQDNLSTFYRQTTYYGTLNYNRSFGDHNVSALAIFSNNQFVRPDEIQNTVALTTGGSVNYMYSNKYIAEVTLMGVGSRKLEEGSRMEMAPSLGLGWIMSEENFMSGSSVIDYLKLRASYGISLNDDFSEFADDNNLNQYNLHKETFTRGSSYYYGNRNYRNGETAYASIPNKITMQRRRDIALGFDATLLNKAMNVELGYFNSTSMDNLTVMEYTYPQLLGYENLVVNNYNSDRTEGIELGLNYTYNVSDDLALTVGGALLHIMPEIIKQEEPRYEGVDAPRLEEGTATDAMWALHADGLYSEADFNVDGTLVDGLPDPLNDVKPGDIKYIDMNSDGVIDNLDQRILGNSQRTQYSLYLDLKYKNFEFYVLGTGYSGDSNYRSGSYYRVFGNVKYSEMANEAWDPNNPDVNATHPRLSATDSKNNNRNSDYWLYENNRFMIPTMQLTYHFNGGKNLEFLKDSRIYLRGGNILVFGNNTKYTEVVTDDYPNTKSLTFGFIASF